MSEIQQELKADLYTVSDEFIDEPANKIKISHFQTMIDMHGHFKFIMSAGEVWVFNGETALMLSEGIVPCRVRYFAVNEYGLRGRGPVFQNEDIHGSDLLKAYAQGFFEGLQYFNDKYNFQALSESNLVKTLKHKYYISGFKNMFGWNHIENQWPQDFTFESIEKESGYYAGILKGLATLINDYPPLFKDFELDTKGLSHSQIALILIYKNEYLTESNKEDVAAAYGVNSAQSLINRYRALFDEGNRLNVDKKKSINAKIADITAILDYLKGNALLKAKEELNILQTKYNNLD